MVDRPEQSVIVPGDDGQFYIRQQSANGEPVLGSPGEGYPTWDHAKRAAGRGAAPHGQLRILVQNESGEARELIVKPDGEPEGQPYDEVRTEAADHAGQPENES